LKFAALTILSAACCKTHGHKAVITNTIMERCKMRNHVCIDCMFSVLWITICVPNLNFLHHYILNLQASTAPVDGSFTSVTHVLPFYQRLKFIRPFILQLRHIHMPYEYYLACDSRVKNCTATHTLQIKTTVSNFSSLLKSSADLKTAPPLFMLQSTFPWK